MHTASLHDLCQYFVRAVRALGIGSGIQRRCHPKDDRRGTDDDGLQPSPSRTTRRRSLRDTDFCGVVESMTKRPREPSVGKDPR